MYRERQTEIIQGNLEPQISSQLLLAYILKNADPDQPLNRQTIITLADIFIRKACPTETLGTYNSEALEQLLLVEQDQISQVVAETALPDLMDWELNIPLDSPLMSVDWSFLLFVIMCIVNGSLSTREEKEQ